MNRIEKTLVLGAVAYMAVYMPYFFAQAYRGVHGANISPYAIIPFHLTGMALNFLALVLTIRDLYLRKFEKENTKLTWLLLILWTGGIGWLVYIFKHALKPRDTDSPGSA